MDKFRFAVCRQDGRCSHTWAVWGRKSDCYVASRHIGGLLKVSLHESGGFRVAFEKKYWQQMREAGVGPPQRVVVVWPKPALPDFGAIHVVSLIFPAVGFAADQPKGTPTKPLYLFEIPDGCTAEFGLFYSLEPIDTLESKLADIGQPLVHTKLDDGRTVSTIARVRDFDINCIPTQAPASGLLNASLRASDAVDNLHAIFWNDPQESGTLQMVEIGGLKLLRDK